MLPIPPSPQIEPPSFWRRRGRALVLTVASAIALIASAALAAFDPGTAAISAAGASLCALIFGVSQLIERSPEPREP